MGDSQGHVQAKSPRNTKPRQWRGRGFCKPSQLALQGGRQRQRQCRMQEKSTRSPRRSATVRQRGSFAASFRPATSSDKTTRDWRARIVEGLVREQPSPVALGRSCRSTPRYQKRSWWLDTSTTAQSRRAVKRWHGCAQDLWNRNVEIAAWVALGAAQAHVGAKHGLTRQRVGQIVQEFPWVRQAVRDRLRSLDENHGKEGGKCQSSSRGWMGSESEDLESEGGCSGEFRPLSRPERTRWRRVCASRGPGDRRRRRRRGCGGRLAALVLESLASASGFPDPERGGKCQFRPTRKGGESASSDRPGKGGKVPSLTAAEISRRWRLRGGAVWRQRGFAFLRPIPPPKLEAPRQYQAQRGLF